MNHLHYILVGALFIVLFFGVITGLLWLHSVWPYIALIFPISLGIVMAWATGFALTELWMGRR